MARLSHEEMCEAWELSRVKICTAIVGRFRYRGQMQVVIRTVPEWAEWFEEMNELYGKGADRE